MKKKFSIETRRIRECVEQRGELLLTFGTFYKNVTTWGPLPMKWCMKQHVHKT